jgi:hypothetical protein
MRHGTITALQVFAAVLLSIPATSCTTDVPAAASLASSISPASDATGSNGWSVSITPPAADLEVGETMEFAASVTNPSGRLVVKQVEWSSTNDGVASVTPHGLVSALGPGTATISARLDDVTASASVTVIARDFTWDVTITDLVNTGAHGIDGLSSNDVWLGCGDECALHFDGAAWTRLSPDVGANVYGAHVRASGDVYFAGQTGIGSGHVIQWNGAFSAVASGPSEMFGVWADGPGSGFACGDGTFIRFAPGEATTIVNTGLNTGFNSPDRFEQAWGTSATNVYCAGRSGVYRYDGTSFARVVPGNFADVSGTSPANVWAVGFPAAVHRFDGSVWMSVDAGQGTEDVLGVSVPSSTSVVLGTHTRVLVLDRSHWRQQAIPEGYRLVAPGGVYAPDTRTVFIAAHRISDNRIVMIRGVR